MKYRVHIYAVVRTPVEVEAASQAEAVEIADKTDLNFLSQDTVPEVEFADQILDFLVDEVGDDEYRNTKLWEIGPDDKPRVKQEEANLSPKREVKISEKNQ